MKTENFTDNNFTALRLMLALLVVLGHFRILYGVPSPEWPFFYASAAVDCFFVVSGYLVSNSFDRDPDLRRFYIKRVFRLYPLYLAVIVAQTVIMGSLVDGGFLANAGSLLRYFAVNAVFANFLQHDVGTGVLSGLTDPGLNPSLWTLKIEFGFYLILPLLWRLVQRYGVPPLVAIFALSALYFEGLTRSGHYEYAKQLPGQLQFFVLGIAAYRYRDHIPFNAMSGLGLAVALAALLTSLLRLHPPVVYPLVVGAFVTVTALRTPLVKLNRDISYGVYLLHGPVIQLSLLTGFYRPDGIGLLAILGIVLALAAVAERTVEAPGIAYGRHLLRRFRGTGTTPPFAGTAPPSPPGADGPSGITVMVLNDFCYVQGGASKVAIEEAVGLARAGVRVIFLGAVGPPCEALKNAALTVECLGQRELLDAAHHPSVVLQALWNGKARRRVSEILQGLPRDRTIVHVHGYTKALTTSPVRAAHRLGIPVICTLHDFFAACPNGAFFDYVRKEPCPKRGLSGSCLATQCDKRHYAHKLYRVARGWIQRLAGRFPYAVHDYIALSKRSAALMSPYLPRRARVHHLANVTDAVPGTRVFAARNRAILCVGRLDAEKGVHLLARTAAGLGMTVTFVGDGPLRSMLEAIPGITVTGWVPRAEVSRHLANARCLVFPSLWYETYGLVVAEAAACGVPAIVSDVSAAAERIENGVTGWVFRSGDTADLARCLSLVADDSSVQAASEAAYRGFWADAPTADVHSDSLIRIYRAALQGS